MYQLENTPEQLRNQINNIVVSNLQIKEISNELIQIFSEAEYQIQIGLSLRESLTSEEDIALIDQKISQLQLTKEETQQRISDTTSILNKGKQMLNAAQAIFNNLTQKV